MATWSDLENELGRWRAIQITPTFFWRDDDAHDATPELEPLLALSQKHQVPVHLAVIPDKLSPGLGTRLAGCTHILTMQHGFAHINHEPRGMGASEFGDHRDMTAQLRDLSQGWRRLEEAHLPNLIPAFVPPWNRMSKQIVMQLAPLGYRLVSAYAGHTPSVPVNGLIRADGHIDPIRWKHGRQFRGAEGMLNLIIAHLVDRREGRVNIAEPTGYLTHHLETEPEIWDFTDELFHRLAHQGIAQWIALPILFQSP